MTDPTDPDDADTRCPISACSAGIPVHLLMCSRHWRQVPPALRDRVNVKWRQRGRAHRAFIAAVRSHESEERREHLRVARLAAEREHEEASEAAIHAVEARAAA